MLCPCGGYVTTSIRKPNGVNILKAECRECGRWEYLHREVSGKNAHNADNVAEITPSDP